MGRGVRAGVLLLAHATALVGLAAAGASAQDPEPPAGEPAPAADTAAPPTPAYDPPRLAFALTIGTLGLDALQTQPVTALLTDLTGSVIGTAPLRRSVQADGGLQLGGYALVGLDRRWAVRLAAGWAETTLTESYQGEDELAVELVERAVAGDAVSLRTLTGEAALRYRIPSATRVQPFLELGGVAVRWDAPETGAAAGLRADQTRLGALAAVGGLLPLTSRVTVSGMAGLRVFRSPIGVAAPDTVQLPTIARLVFEPPAALPFADGAREVLSVIRVDLGISVGIGSYPDPPPAARPEMPETPPTPGR